MSHHYENPHESHETFAHFKHTWEDPLSNDHTPNNPPNPHVLPHIDPHKSHTAFANFKHTNEDPLYNGNPVEQRHHAEKSTSSHHHLHHEHH
ncbi:unnamed protein product, partial [Mesorhabditis belari]|uniref:Uncharacterized protein n=1 Tax=Mesorhabditis belari TaxID=2138241 RepID=A0AAF3EFS0_9BILA